MRLHSHYLAAAGLLLAVISIANGAEVLANSSYPCLGGNAQRTYKINRNFHCPTQSNGRSTVLNVAWTWPPEGFDFNFASTEITTDAQDRIYVQGQTSTSFVIHRVYFENGTLSTDTGFTPQANLPASLTHVASGFMYLATTVYSEFVEESSMTAFASVTNPVIVSKPASYLPFGDYMLRANVGLASDFQDVLAYWDITSRLFDTGATNFVQGKPIDVVIGVQAATEFFIVVADRSPFPEYPIYTANFTNNYMSNPPVRAWFEDEKIFVLTTGTLFVYNFTTSLEYTLQTYLRQSLEATQTNHFIMVHEGQTFAHYTYNETIAEFYDAINFKTITTTPAPYYPWPPVSQPLFSKLDNIVMYPKAISGSNVYFEGRQWGTWNIKVTGRLPKGVVYDDNANATGVAIFSDNCGVAIVHGNKMYGLKPLPIQNVVPIFECYNPDTGIAFFSYNNLEQNAFVIPLTQDRNSFTPYSTPIEDFDVGGGPTYPLSAQLDVGKNIQGYHYWALERYTVPIPFGDSSIVCPTTINIIIKLLANEQFPVNFGEVVRSKFVSVTGISDSRVTLVAKKRNINQADSALEAELAVAPDQKNVEEQPAEVVQNFVENQQNTFSQQINADPTAPQNVTVESITGKELSGQIVGIKDYVPTPSAPLSPINTPASPSVPSTVPKTSAAISSGDFGLVSLCVIMLFTILN